MTTNKSTLNKTAVVFPVRFSPPVFQHGATFSSFLSQNANHEYSQRCSSFSSAENGHNCDYRLHYDTACIYNYLCVFHTTGLLVLAEGPDALSVSVVQLSRNSIRNFIGLLQRVSVATDRIVWLSLMVDRGLKIQRWLVIWDCLTHMENAGLCYDQPKGRWADCNACECKSSDTFSFL